MIYIGNFDSYMSFDERSQTLVSNRGEVYAVGKKVRVVVAGVNEEEHKIDLRPDTMNKKELMYLKKSAIHQLQNVKNQSKCTAF